MDERKDDRPPFRWNPQAVFMLFFFMLAMAVPLMGVVWFARGYLSSLTARPAAPTHKAVVDTSSLEKGLERMSDVQFAAAVSVEDKGNIMELAVAPGDLEARIARILAIAKEARGSGLETSAADAEPRRLVLRVPASRAELLKRAILGERIDFSAIPAGADTQILEVSLRKP